MKFGKRLKKQVEESLPEWRSKFLAYKNLKKLIRLASATPPRRSGGAVEAAFVRLLNDEVDKFNAFFLEQEEEFIIRQKEVKEMVKKVRPEERSRVRKEVVDLHGEMVLMLNYSAINYTGLGKILKKYDKRNGRLLRLPFIEKVLKQPFFSTELMSRLVRDCETMMDSVFATTTTTKDHRWKKVEVDGEAEQGIFRSTVAALLTMKELRSGSSTSGKFSLPPMAVVSPESGMLQSIQVADPIPI